MGIAKFKHISQSWFVQSINMWNGAAHFLVYTPVFKTVSSRDDDNIKGFVQQLTIQSLLYSLLYYKQDHLDSICLSGPFPRKKQCQAGCCSRDLRCGAGESRERRGSWREKCTDQNQHSKQPTGTTCRLAKMGGWQLQPQFCGEKENAITPFDEWITFGVNAPTRGGTKMEGCFVFSSLLGTGRG